MEKHTLIFEGVNGRKFGLTFPAFDKEQAKRIVSNCKLKNAKYDNQLIDSQNTDLDKKFLKE